MANDALFIGNFVIVVCVCSITRLRVLARLPMPSMVCAHADWPVDKLSGLEK